MKAVLSRPQHLHLGRVKIKELLTFLKESEFDSFFKYKSVLKSSCVQCSIAHAQINYGNQKGDPPSSLPAVFRQACMEVHPKTV